MSVVSVQPKDFILALFIRDDGERFLLGDKGYDFMDSQLHFAANTIENDEVEKQGADGTMLAGQVRRASVQTFDGYVGDATTPKEEIEQMRRAFIAFFLKGHHYRVVYVDCARNAWQRKGGYLVDAPEVKELFQVHPEYHVGLNFEDVNYYSYDENAEGDEITANLVQVAISSAVEGGLVWDEDGAVSEDATVVYDGDTATASGTSITVSDAVEAPLSDFKLKGETSQQTYSGKNKLKLTGATATGVTGSVNADGSYTISGKATSGSAGVIFNQAVTVPAGTYTFTISQALPVVINLTFGSGLGFRLEPGQTSFTRTLPNDVTSGGQIYFAMQNGVTYDITLNWQLTPGSSADTDFEPYVGGVPAPNPDYPQAVKVVTGENVVKISDGQGNEQSYTVDLASKNLFDKSAATDGYRLDASGAPYADASYTLSDYIEVEPNTKYTLSGMPGSSYGHVATYTSSKSFDYRWYVGSDPYTFTTGATAKYIRIATPLVCKDTTQCELGQSATTYEAFWQIELCKIGDYQDSIYKSDGKWYVHKEVGKIPSYAGETISTDYISTTGSLTTGATVYYALATPTDTEITNAALVAQLEAILSQGYTYAGTNNITTVIAAGNEQGELEITYYTSYEAKVVGGGYEWEQGGSGGPTTVMNESIDNVYPIWTITGPITNPVLENTTTGEQIEYVGTIGEGQTLVIDMGAQTALLDGLNVVANIVGEFLSLAPGSNTLIYSVDSGDKASEIGWSEIVG